MIKIGNNNISKIYLEEQSIYKAILGTSDGHEVIFEDRSAGNWGEWVEIRDGREIRHPQSSATAIANALERHRNGVINLFDEKAYPGWAIGSERTVNLSAIEKVGAKSLTGTVWVFDGRVKKTVTTTTSNTGSATVTISNPKDSNANYDPGFKEIDLSSVPDFSEGHYWKIDFKWYRRLKSKKKNKKGKYVVKNKWIGSFNGLAKVSDLPGCPLCFLKVEESSHMTTPVYYNTDTKKEWAKPSYSSKKYKLVYYKIGDYEIFSPYQKIKISGGEDVDNEELWNWLKKWATCKSVTSDKDWSVEEAQPATDVHLVLAHKFAEKDENGVFVSKTPNVNGYIDGFKLAEWESSDDDVPLFGVVQKEVLPNSGILLKKTNKKKKNYGSSANNWVNTTRRDWCNKGYLRALPGDLSGKVLQEFTWLMGKGGSATTTIIERTDTIGLPLQRHICEKRLFDINTSTAGKNHGCAAEEWGIHTQWDYYKIDSNRKKKDKDGEIRYYWTISADSHTLSMPGTEDTEKYQGYITITADGTPHTSESLHNYSLSPIMII